MSVKFRIRVFPLIGGMMLLCFNIFAQKQSNISISSREGGTYLKAVILDSLTRKPIEFATLSLKYVGDKTPSNYALSDSSGLVVIAKAKIGRAKMTMESVGYKSKSRTVDVHKGANDCGIIYVQEAVNVLNTIVVTDKVNPMTVKKDTIEYNAAAVKINETDMLEDLLKKLPGIQVASDGTITANGKTISKVMIEGKVFFMNDPVIATKNLPAQIVDKVKVVNKKSDQAEFTGIDDGDEETVLDLSIKKGMMDGLFGNVNGGLGNKKRYESGGMVGKFTKKTQISLIGNLNNTNNRGFNDAAGAMMGNMRYGMGGMSGPFGGSGNGLTKSWMIGSNVSTSLLHDKMDAIGNYLYSGSDKSVQERKMTTTMLSASRTLYKNENGYDNTTTDGQRFQGQMIYNISKKTSIIFRPNVVIGNGNFDSYDEYSTITNSDSTNAGVSRTFGDNDSQQLGGMVMWRQRLGKPGRTMTLRFGYDYSNNEMNGFNKSKTNFYDEGVMDSTSVIDQKYHQFDRSNETSVRFSYTEPLGRNYFIEASYRYNYKKTNSDKNTWDTDKDGDYVVRNDSLSSKYDNTFIRQRIELDFMKQEEKYNFMFGVSLQPSQTQSSGRKTIHGIVDTTYNVTNFAPFARLDYRISDTKFLRVFYRGRTEQPSISQLLPVADNSNPLKITIGNDKLDPSFSHNLYLIYRTNNKKKFSWFGLRMQGSYTQDDIISRTVYRDDGVQQTSYVNSHKGIYSFNGSMMYNTPIAKSNFSVSTNTNASYGNGVKYVYSSDVKNYVENTTKTLSLSEDMRFTYRNDILEIRLGGRVNYRNAWYSVKTIDDVSTWTNSITGSVNVNIPGGFNVTSDINHTFYIGFGDGYGDPSTVWNASLSKNLFKNKFTFTAKIYDILKDARNTYRTNSENYIRDTWNNTLGQYLMFSLTYRFGDFGKAMKNSGFRPGMRGGRRHYH